MRQSRFKVMNDPYHAAHTLAEECPCCSSSAATALRLGTNTWERSKLSCWGEISILNDSTRDSRQLRRGLRTVKLDDLGTVPAMRQAGPTAHDGVSSA
jgi:hypothetical protein